ncbi:hypothetical protein BCV71DRAFT_190079, partial [Rhizopus microsporus]
THSSFTTNSVFSNALVFNINLKRSMAWSKKGTPVIITVPTIKVETGSNLSVISTSSLINVNKNS